MRIALAVAVLTTGGAALGAPLTKEDAAPSIKQLLPKIRECYAKALEHAPDLGDGVFNLHVAIDSSSAGVSVKTLGFDTTGALGQSTELRTCATAALDGASLPAITAPGKIEMLYPLTFARQPVDNHDKKLFVQAKRARAGKRWKVALTSAERGLELTSLDGTFRRQLVEIAGVAACHLGNADKARHYALLASSKVERIVRTTCTGTGTTL